jgi:YD repeat-containing protein
VLHAQDHAENVGLERRGKAFRGLVRDRADLAFGGGVVHRDIETAKPCDGLVDQSADVTRADANESLTETLTYDTLNRLTSATVSANMAPEKTFSYDPIGNLLSKSDVGAYTYPVAGSALPHAVSVINGTINSTFTYDPNGNETASLGRSISYTSYNMAASITAGSNTLSFAYDMDHQRMSKVNPIGQTLYFDAFGVHAELMISSTSTWYDYLTAGGAMVAMRVSGSIVATRYLHTDNLGSTSVLTDETGAVVERDGYDAWGKRRFPSGADDPTGSLIASQVHRNFTGEEFLGIPGFVHLNGRLYDPLIARMVSADPWCRTR